MEAGKLASSRLEGLRAWPHELLRVALVVAGASLTVGLAPTPPAFADIGACSSIEPPRNEAEAIDRAALAFDGVVVEGRACRDRRTGC